MAFKTKLLLKSSGFRILQTFIMIIIGFAMMPFMISVLGEELYGLWIVISSVVGTYYLLDLGFSQAVTRYVAKYIHQENPEAANRVINTALVLYSILGLGVLIISVLGAHLGVEKFMGESNNISLVQTLLILAGLTLAVEFPAKSFPGIISAYMRYDFIAIIRILKAIVDAALIYFFLSSGYGLVSIAVITLVTGTISTLIYVRFASSLFEALSFDRKWIDLTTLKDVFHFSKWVFVFDMNTLLRTKMDIWFIAFFQSSALLTVYYVAVRLTEYSMQFLTQATNFTGPIFTEYYAKAESEKLQQSVAAFIKINILLGTIFIVGFYLAGTSFIRLWMGEDFAYQEAYLCLVILALGRFSVYFSAPIQSLLMTLNRHNISAWVSLVETGGAAIMMFFLVRSYGIVGAALAIAVSISIGRLIVIPFITVRVTDIRFANMVPRIGLFGASTLIFALTVNHQMPFLRELTLFQLLLAAVLIACIQAALGALLFTKSEVEWVFAKVRKR